MKKKIIGIILAGMMIMTACGNAGKAEPEGLSEGRTESSEEAGNVEESTEESSVVEEDSANNKFAQKAVEKSGKTIEDVRDIISKDFDGEGKEDEAMITGHSWKNYYFYYDKAAGDFAEFEATEITEQELNEAVGTDLVSEIKAEGYDIDNIIKRDNGIINVNYSKTTKNDDGTILKECKNITYLTKEGRYFDVWGTGEETWQNSDFGGIYDVMLTK